MHSTKTGPDATKAEGGIWQARAAGWELLAWAFQYPGEECAELFGSGEWAAAAKEVAEALSFDWMPTPVESASLDALRREHTRLFGGFPAPLIDPYEGRVRAMREGEVPLLVVNPYSMSVERFCRDCGLGRPQGTNEPLDHVATECELLEHLASVACGIAKPMVSEQSLPGCGAQAAYEAFFAEHASSWMGDFADSVADAANVSSLHDAAAFMSAFLGVAC